MAEVARSDQRVQDRQEGDAGQNEPDVHVWLIGGEWAEIEQCQQQKVDYYEGNVLEALLEEIFLLVVDLLDLDVDEFDDVEEDEDHQGEGGHVAEVADGEGGEEYLEGPEDGVAHAVVVGGQLVLGDLQEVEVLEVVQELGVLALVVLLAGVEGHEHRPGETAQEGEDADGRIDSLISVAAGGVAKVVELHEADPYRGQKLVPPDLIGGVDKPTSNFIQKLVDNSLLLLYEIFVHDLSGDEEQEEPDGIDDVDNDDGVELAEEVDVGSEEVEADWAVLDHVAHPLVLDRCAVRGDEEVQVLDQVQFPDCVPEGQRQVVRCYVYVQEYQLQGQDILLGDYALAQHHSNDDEDGCYSGCNCEEHRKNANSLDLSLWEDVESFDLEATPKGGAGHRGLQQPSGSIPVDVDLPLGETLLDEDEHV